MFFRLTMIHMYIFVPCEIAVPSVSPKFGINISRILDADVGFAAFFPMDIHIEVDLYFRTHRNFRRLTMLCIHRHICFAILLPFGGCMCHLKSRFRKRVKR